MTISTDERYRRLAVRTGARGRPVAVVASALRAYHRDLARTVPDIADAHGVPVRTLQNWATRVGLPARPSRPLSSVTSADELHRTAELVHETGSIGAAGRALGMCWSGVQRRLERAANLDRTETA